jgi:predicted Zn-dependent protease
MRTKIILIVCCLFIITGCRKTINPYSNNPGDPDYFYNRPVGASANELLSDSKFKSLKVEIQFMAGFEPNGSSLTHLQNLLATLLNKPAGINIVTKEIPSSASTQLSTNQVLEIENNNRTAFTTGDQFAIYILFTNGVFTDNNVLGAAYRNSSMVVFGKNIKDNSGGLGQPSRVKLESTVLEHEIGHVLGLVDIGSAMQTNHKDATHGNHCNNSGCLMYYSADTKDVLGFLITGNTPSFDSNCLADLRANGGK